MAVFSLQYSIASAWACEGLMGLWKMVNAGNVETGVVVANGASPAPQ